MSLSRDILNNLYEEKEDFIQNGDMDEKDLELSNEEYEKKLSTPDSNGISLERDNSVPGSNSFIVHHDYDDIHTDEGLKDYFVKVIGKKLKNTTTPDIIENISEVNYGKKYVIYKGMKFKFDQEFGCFEDEKGKLY